MAGPGHLKFDEVGIWTEIKLAILVDYSQEYTRIVGSAQGPGRNLRPVYIDAFSGAGVHIAKGTRNLVPGSPLNALHTDPPFEELHLIDLDSTRADYLEQTVEELGESGRVHVYRGDCNQVLPSQVFPQVQHEDYRRGLLLLDPYGLNLHWETVLAAAATRTIDVFINFPMMGMNRNAFWRDYEAREPKDLERMDRFWGDGSWRKAVYQRPSQMQLDFVQGPELEKRRGNLAIAQAYQKRLQEVAGFEYVPNPMVMTNSRNSALYYLFFASHREVAKRIAEGVFRKYRKQMATGGR